MFPPSSRPPLLFAGVVATALAIVLVFGFVVGNTKDDALLTAIIGLVAVPIAVAVLLNPYVGLVATSASLPLLDLLPDVPIATSTVSLLGALTLVSYVIDRLRRKQSIVPSLGFPGVFGALFIAWFSISNISAALSEGGLRNWLSTYLQLWVLMLLTGVLLSTPQRQRVLMYFYSAGAIVSAFVAVSQGIIGSSIKESVRAVGLSEGPNTTARYLTIAFVFLFYLCVTTKVGWLRALLLGSLLLTATGVLFTVSRTGFITLVIAVALLVFTGSSATRSRQLGLAVVLVAAALMFVPESYWQILQTSVLPSLQEGTDTVGLRYGLWQAGLRMWLDHPIAGVGIGQFTTQLPAYGWDLLPSYRLNLGAHDVYIAVLSETGLIGLSLFLLMLASSLRLVIKAMLNASTATRQLARTWLIVLIVILVGGITKHDQYDKLLWLACGAGLAIRSKAYEGLSSLDVGAQS